MRLVSYTSVRQKAPFHALADTLSDLEDWEGKAPSAKPLTLRAAGC
jgi:hypothetical protein